VQYFKTYIVNLKDNYCAVHLCLPTLVFVFVWPQHATSSGERQDTLCRQH